MLPKDMKKMKNKEYTDSVDVGKFPETPIVPLDSPFIDDRGTIQNLLNTPIHGAAIITSKKGAVRSNHWHRTDWHYLYLISGSMMYYERHVFSSASMSGPYLVKAGQMVFTPPNIIHKTEFLEETVLLSFSKRNRDHASHEADVVREDY